MRFVLVLVALALLLPASSATWHGVGSSEPSTPQDATQGWMFRDAPTDGNEGLFFDAFATLRDAVVNPNSATLGGRMLPPGATTFRAFFGAWEDCNGDGYIGLAEGAVQDYSAALLPEGSACRNVGPHNDGTWVTELLMVGMVDPCEKASQAERDAHCPGVAAFFRNTRVMYADHARVWGDAGRPDEGLVRCPVFPLPRGASSSAGDVLRAVDCHDGYAVRAEVDAAAPQAGAILDAPFPANLFGAPGGPHGVLERGSGDPSFTVWDCSSPKGTADVKDPFGLNDISVADPSGTQLSGKKVYPIVGTTNYFADEDNDPSTPGRFRPAPDDASGSIAWAPRFAPQLNDPTGSSWDALEAAADGPRGDCDASTTNALGAHYPQDAVEGRDEAGVPGEKARNDFVFSFYDGYRGFNEHIDPYTDPNAPTDGGVIATRDSHGGALWSATTFALTRPPLVRADEQQAEGPAWFSFYASTDLHGVARPTSAVGTYGAEACAVIARGAPSSNGWRCDPDAWWRDSADADTMPRYTDGYGLGASVGDDFLLRDVDCYDGAPDGDVRAGVGLAFVSPEGGCPQP